MNLHSLIENVLLRAADVVYRRLPQPVPDIQRLKQCRLVSHRGEHENLGGLENTIPAFEAAIAGGVWGIEFDVRWTKDLQPVVIHDADTLRVFGSRMHIRSSTFRELRHTHRMVPHLEEVVQAFGGRIHLMIELKEEPYPDPEVQQRYFEKIFSCLVPQQHFHFISLVPQLFDHIEFLPIRALLPIAQTNIKAMSQLTLSNRFGGLLGHYFLLTDATVKKHRLMGQATGTGFVNSKNCLFRELNRGINWIFSNRAIAMQSVINKHLAEA